MIKKALRKHQWMEFYRNPMVDQNIGVMIFMFVMLGMLAAELSAIGFILDKALLKTGEYERAIDTFNSLLIYVFAVDFIIKFILKPNQSMQIVPYLSLPVKRNTLFNFLLQKEFTSLWNFWILFLLVPFVFKAIVPFFGFISAILYILFIYILCIINSLVINLANNLVKRNVRYYIPVVAVVILPVVFAYTGIIDIRSFTQRLGEALLNNNPMIWIGLIVLFTAIWIINRKLMRSDVYRELQGVKIEKISSFSSISFLDRLGVIGEFIQLDIRLTLRAKRLKTQFFAFGYIIFLYISLLYKSNGAVVKENPVLLSFFGIFTVGFIGLMRTPLIFSSESSFFDGLMTRKASVLDMMKGKYLLYSSSALFMTLLLLIPVFQGRLSFLFLIANFFYVVGTIFFMLFQHAVYNKNYLDIYSSGWMNWQGQSGNMMIISMLTLLIPVLPVYFVFAYFGKEVGSWFMLITGLAFTLTSIQWLRWTYNRFLKRRYNNMEGFRMDN